MPEGHFNLGIHCPRCGHSAHRHEPVFGNDGHEYGMWLDCSQCLAEDELRSEVCFEMTMAYIQADTYRCSSVVEQQAFNLTVEGSIPSTGTTYPKVCPNCGYTCIGGWCGRCREAFPGRP